MIGIINKEYKEMMPMFGRIRALTTINFEDAKIVFSNIDSIDFVIALNEKTGTFGHCYNLMECEEFYKEEKVEITEQPYIKTKIITEHFEYNPKYGDDRICECGHPYYRHFDTYEEMANIGCKYCQCYDFK